MKPQIKQGFSPPRLPQGGKTRGPKGDKDKKKQGGFFKHFDPSQPITGKQAKRFMNAADRIQHRPLARQLAAEQQASSFRERQEIPAFFQQYQNDLARLRGETQGAYDAASGRIQAATSLAGQQDASNRAAMMQRLQADAQARGVAFDPNIDTQQVNAEAARQNVATSTLGTVAGQGANAFARNSNLQGIAGLQAIEQRGIEAARGRKISADRRELARSRGDYRYQTLRDLIGDERKFGLELKAIRTDKQIAKMEERGQNARNAADNATSRANNAADNKATAKQKAKDRRHDTNQAKKDRIADKKKARLEGKGKKGKKL